MKQLLHLLKQHQTWQIGGLLAADLVFFNLVNPVTAPSPLVALGTVLLVGTFYVFMRALARLVTVYTGTAGERGRRLSGLLSIAFAVVVGLQSIGQLTVRDVLALGLLTAVGYLYFSRSRQSA